MIILFFSDLSDNKKENLINNIRTKLTDDVMLKLDLLYPIKNILIQLFPQLKIFREYKNYVGDVLDINSSATINNVPIQNKILEFRETMTNTYGNTCLSDLVYNSIKANRSKHIFVDNILSRDELLSTISNLLNGRNAKFIILEVFNKNYDRTKAVSAIIPEHLKKTFIYSEDVLKEFNQDLKKLSVNFVNLNLDFYTDTEKFELKKLLQTFSKPKNTLKVELGPSSIIDSTEYVVNTILNEEDDLELHDDP